MSLQYKVVDPKDYEKRKILFIEMKDCWSKIWVRCC